MKLTSWAICSVALAAGVFGADRPELFKNLPRCTISCLEKYNNSDLEAVDICNNEDVKRELDNCFADKCRDFERFDIAKIYANACDSKQKDNRNNHYVLLVVEIPAWIFPWLRLYLSWITYESLSLDDYVMVVCGLLYTVFATLVHFAHSVTGDTILWNAVPEHITDGLKLVFMADIFELACSCLLRVAILLVCLRSSFSGRGIAATAATLVLTILSSIALALLRVFRCSPIAFAWEGWEPNGRDEVTGACLAQDSLAYTASSIDMFLNLVLLAMLSHLIFSRAASNTTSWLQNATAVMLGAFGLAVSCFRLYLLIDFFKTMQPVWKYHERIVWMDVEISVLIMWACLPTWQCFTDSVPPRDVEEVSRLPQIIEETIMPETPSTDTKIPRPRLCQRGVLGILSRGRPKKLVESNLHLGDKTYGNVRTEIQGGQRFSMISQLTGMIGIQVRTRTIRHVHDSGWDAEKGSARENIEAA
ncbi:hypothetical protein FVEG_00575 [Fusarium verticillioides 7600]|uniref:Rhodopsin domain-containing protein n=1 Tax=Gibberella moniliformis (strain M3125 / FGSC 7600) TaxID=334819 RepID=W7LMH5_GIBM7|nr:hypothetical protein FVEG_00575 [Fusarium verticillioides 7600]XP_018742836.1 hypothetical protein FVEG_00575 [Fusarium verticillioides 7600]EWG36644.1 hypothetical protein FVEG_00575 [Fusarium verticillioides 7600]EWG36645.1 hypothetical protein FVEG_00575 [Fusarium verticillioides 7600]